MPVKRYRRGMHPYHHYYNRRTQVGKRRARKWLIICISVLFIAITMVGVGLYSRPLPSVAPQKSSISHIKVTVPSIAWPSGAQSAFGTVTSGLLASSPRQTPRPTASTAKLITALVILDKKPLKKGEQGPTITITPEDVAIYNDYFAKNGSLAEVVAGERLTEYQMLQGILLPSANNFADTLAIWAFGSLENYQKAANAYVKKLGMNQTTVGVDASGFSPTTMSTASDLTRLAVVAMKHPVVAEIVSQPEVNLPVAGVKQNTNWLLSTDGVIGLKTGNTDEAGGVYVFAVKEQIGQFDTVLVGAVQGKPTLLEAIIEARNLIRTLQPQFVLATPVKKGDTFAIFEAPWGARVSAQSENDIKFIHWIGEKVDIQTTLSNATITLPKGSPVGLVKVGNQSSQLILSGQLQAPSWQWRLWHNAAQ